jgi:hypothetical protein
MSCAVPLAGLAFESVFSMYFVYTMYPSGERLS